MRHPLDVPEGTMFNNTLAAAAPSREAFVRAIERLEALLEERSSIHLKRPCPTPPLPDDA